MDWLEVLFGGIFGGVAMGAGLLAFRLVNGQSGSKATKELIVKQRAEQVGAFSEKELDRLFPTGSDLEPLIQQFGDRRELALHIVRGLGPAASSPGTFEEARTIDGVPVLVKGNVHAGVVRLESVSLRVVDQD